MARIVGWCAHSIEELNFEDRRIIRPAYMNVFGEGVCGVGKEVEGFTARWKLSWAKEVLPLGMAAISLVTAAKVSIYTCTP